MGSSPSASFLRKRRRSGEACFGVLSSESNRFITIVTAFTPNSELTTPNYFLFDEGKA